jgi:cytochrome b
MAKFNRSDDGAALQTTSDATTVKVWDLPTRLFHWSLVLLIAVSWLTAQAGDERLLRIHFFSGYAVLTLVIFRIVWGVIGSTHSRFSDFLKGAPAVLHHIADLKRPGAPADRGHNPLGGWMIVVILATLGAQAGTGLFANDDIVTYGPLASLVSDAASAKLTTLHKLNFNLILALIGLHVAAVLAFLVIKRQNLIIAMITGRKPRQGTVGSPAKFTSSRVALIAVAGAAGLVWFVVTRG